MTPLVEDHEQFYKVASKMTNKTRIPVVDDEPQIQRLLQVELSSYGYTVLPVSNGQDAIVTATRQQPDIIVLDINLGSDPDGPDLCRKIREWSTTPLLCSPLTMIKVQNLLL
jgi:two-component system KDP operon response regulator KdpE